MALGLVCIVVYNRSHITSLARWHKLCWTLNYCYPESLVTYNGWFAVEGYAICK